jgi:hypothetical protein
MNWLNLGIVPPIYPHLPPNNMPFTQYSIEIKSLLC